MNWFKKKIPLFIVIVVVLVFFVFMNKKEASTPLSASLISSEPAEPAESPLTVETIEEKERAAVVDIKGEVVRPGVYEIEEGDRIQDIIERAEGFTEDADVFQVNLAQILQDEMVVLIPAVGQEGDTADTSVGEQTNNKVKINSATSEELTQLPGIGPAKAEAIIAHRDNHGQFQKAEDLLDISGIGEKTLETLIEHIQVP
ncbi:helix-hairpin-helix domain-containing protein [Oceanobacillus neutriphilus]|uniref:Competence protein ComE n=1 Tax=Oceanobacillus neutriphilus TaxID=531815 RepID=A0ABQ2NWX7_9BACI|nr:helix-hairpin-helix domain-containing protein [Oceanobacillus neutriphilus]GGP12558.1 competence protein ComE [Oceanobacillus neutriphilus]